MRFTAKEWQVMDVLWANSPASVRDIVQALEGETGLKASAVRTTLRRLVDQDVLSVERRGNANHFTPIVSRDTVRRVALRSLVDGAAGALTSHVTSPAALGSGAREKLGELLAAAATQDTAVGATPSGTPATTTKTNRDDGDA